MMHRILSCALLAVTLTATAACDKKGNEDKPAASARQGDDPPAAPAPASRAECEKVVANQLALEKDPSMKSAMEMSKAGLLDECMKLTSTQAQCAAAAAGNQAFADCLLAK